MTIKQKLIIFILIVAVLLLLLGSVIFFGYRHVTGVASLANDFDKETMYLQMMFSGLNEVIVNEGTTSSIKAATDGFQGFDKIHKRLLKQVTVPEILVILTEDIDPHWQKIERNINPFFEHYLDLGDDETLILAGRLIAESEDIINHVRVLSENTRAIVDSNSVKSEIVEKTMVYIFSAILLLAALPAYRIYYSITRPIKELTHIAEGFNRGDLTVMMDESRKDEFGELARYFNKSTTRLNQTTQKLHDRTQELTELNTKLQTEIAERKQAEEVVSYMAYHDSLTGLPNRYLFQDRLNIYIAQVKRHQRKAAVLFLDIDDFKRINDTLGHSVGDLLLKEVSEKMKDCIRETDTVSKLAIYDAETSTTARIGGDEFTILITDIRGSQDAVKVAQRIMNVVSHPFQLNDNEVFITMSIGIAVSPDDGKDADILLKNADAAMYHAKKRGKNNFQFYKESMNSLIRKRLTMENELRKAIERNELLLNYQPRIDIRTGNIISMEALVRWQKTDKGLISPAEFIPVAEDTGLIIPIGEWILKTACAQNKAWQDAGLIPLSISVNISGIQFQHENFITIISNALKDSSLDPGYLELEITESVLMQNVDNTIDTLRKLKKMGVRFSMDDFGTGYSSFSYLKRFPLDVIKIDKSFIDDIPENTDTAAIVTAIIKMAHSLNLGVVAEGVESKQQLTFLCDNECDEVQGYYFSPPLSTKEFTEFFEKSMRQPLETA